MILAPVLVKLTRSLEVLIEKEKEGVSSYVEVKQKTLAYLANFLEKAPKNEYLQLLKDRDHSILLGYFLNILCRISSLDKSKNVRKQALDSMKILVNRLSTIHNLEETQETCSISPLVSALPGVISTLIKLIMSDTKLPKSLFVAAIQTLTEFLSATFSSCNHQVKSEVSPGMTEENLTEICDNLALRLKLLIHYTINHSSDLPDEMKHEILKLCEALVFRTRHELLTRVLVSIVKFIAYMSSTQFNQPEVETQLTIMLIIDKVRECIKTNDSNSNRLETTILSTLFKMLENLNENYLTMLISEREAELSMLHGILRILPRESVTILLEVPEKRNQLVELLVNLTHFSTDQPFLFLTDVPICEQAIENTSNIYTMEKRFSTLTASEIRSVRECCLIIGKEADWFALTDLIRELTTLFKDSSTLYIAQILLIGCLDRESPDARIVRFSAQMLVQYLSNINDEYEDVVFYIDEYDSVNPEVVLKIVIAVESLVTLVELHNKLGAAEDDKTILLKPLLCPLLSWSSAGSRAISEASLSAITKISSLYAYPSIKSMIEHNIDYIVDGIGKMLDTFALNPEITNVLALALKLSSIDILYFFRDIYAKVFRILGIYHQSDRSQPILLLFTRTLTILADWKTATDSEHCDNKLSPLEDIRPILEDLDIVTRVKKLQKNYDEAEKAKREIEILNSKKLDEQEVVDEINSGTIPMSYTQSSETKSEAEDTNNLGDVEKSPASLLTEQIMEQCVNLISSDYDENKILALKTATCGFRVLKDEENTLLPLVHKVWTPLVRRLTGDYSRNLEVNLCAFECLVAMASCAKDFIKSRTLDLIIPRLCLFLETQAKSSIGQQDYSPYCMTMVYKCQLKILTELGALAYNIQLAYRALWRVIRVALLYLDPDQNPSLRKAAYTSLLHMMALDADCVWYFAKTSSKLNDLPFERIFLMEN